MFAAVMRLLLKCLRLGRRRRFKLVRQAEQLWQYGHLCLHSLLYNSFTNGDVVLDSLFEPVYWLVDHVTRWFGVVSTLTGQGTPGSGGWGECAAGTTESQGCLCSRQEGSGDLSLWFSLFSCGFILPVPLPRQRGAGAACSGDPGPFPVGVCGTGDRADELHCGHCVHLPAAPHPADLHTRLDLLAPRLRTLEPHHDCLPLLHGHHHLTRAPTAGEAPTGSAASPSWALGTAESAWWHHCRMPPPDQGS